MLKGVSVNYVIYKTTNLINGKNYIGQHKTEKPDDRYLGSGSALKAAIKKYGKENFKKEILLVTTEETVNQDEIRIIKEYKEKGEAQYNIAGGGQGCSNPFLYLSEEEKQKIKQKQSKARKGKKSGSYGKTWKVKTKNKTVNIKNTFNRKVICLDDNKEFESASEAGRFYNIDSSSISKVCKGKRKKVNGLRFAYVGEADNVFEREKKKVICLDDNKEFESIKEAAKFYDLDNSSISKVCKGKKYSVKGLRFQYA